MHDSYVQVAPDSTGKRIDNATFIRDSVDIFRQRVEAYDLPVELQANWLGALGAHSARFVQIMGSRTLGWDNTTDFGDACEYLNTTQTGMNTPTIGQTLYAVSTSANDAAGGTGVNTVRILYLDAAGLQQRTTVTLNGTTPVSIGAGFSFIQWAESASVGAGGVAAGAISVTSTNGAATVATTFDRIAAGGNRSLSGRYRVPSDCTGLLKQWHVSAISATMDCRLRGDFFADDDTLSPGVFHFIDRCFLASGANQDIDLHYRKVPAGATLKISAIPGAAAAGNKLECDFSLICIENAA